MVINLKLIPENYYKKSQTEMAPTIVHNKTLNDLSLTTQAIFNFMMY